MSAEQVASPVVDREALAGGTASAGDGRGGGTSIGRRLLRDPLAVAALVYVTLVVLVGILAPLLAPNGPNHVDVSQANTPPFVGDFVLGGDSSGRDILSRLLWATRGTLLSCVIVLAVSTVVGVVGGLLAGYFRGPAEAIAGWVADAVMALPGIVLLIAMYTVIGPSIPMAMAVFGVLIAPANYRLVRAVVAEVRGELYIDAAKVSGLSDLRIIFRHVLTAVRAPIIIQSGFILAAGIGIQAGLEFLGLGDPRDPSWGGVLQQAFSTVYLNRGAVVAPALVVSLTILAFVLLGNALRDALQGSGRNRPATAERLAAARAAHPASSHTPEADALVSVRGLALGYPDGEGGVSEVVESVDLCVHRGEIHGLVGESGSGKSQTAFAMLGLLPKDAVVLGGAVLFDGADLLADTAAMRRARGTRIAYVPQEPMSNLDPTITIGRQLTLGLRAVKRMPKAQARIHLLGILGRVGIADPEAVFAMYPHQISGGMAQRVLITGALAGDPELIVADEPTTALDVTVQADVLALLRELRDERGLGMLLVTHDLGVVADICDTVSVMRGGTIVEQQEVRSLFADPEHPYTRELLSSALDPEES
ncbi:dipeptide/oligopeptide/nickel ABC transporter permease/ATP-binding protein [Streptomyces sp. NBC_00006]|uniref:dipeptide/oligopeptide/nickel ABC transporter permease/ATP-binding protein n=1 Tax=unclassified Streptomyces TaxID=2593676 RepID=UPI00224F55C1|nr:MULTISPECIES: dipeptide/oligopeptide/nickel ABC transporter permease/ATP-binding protein [unclassified Streptomyces]MCX4834594.1 dipeptide/oligopeptide/nickel ABC transporter permease/ATP-binding protein [Streptomyces sp. NBC_01016]MCX5529585.1 dipeptide/oligopeptide/nickel ABC transporter permease/ATP-binding protein [Streptomyces sp. NBC_00006]